VEVDRHVRGGSAQISRAGRAPPDSHRGL